MQIVNNVKVYGMEESIAASKYPMSVNVADCNPEVTKMVEKLASCKKGTGHDQFLTGIVVQFDLTFSIKSWTEVERYHFFDFVSSQSTMHRIANFNFEKSVNRYVDPATLATLQCLKHIYSEEPTEENYLKLLYNVPTGFKLTARMTTNYRQLKTIYAQRKNHKLPEWREFCKWIETLPNSKFITSDDKSDVDELEEKYHSQLRLVSQYHETLSQIARNGAELERISKKDNLDMCDRQILEEVAEKMKGAF